MNTKSKLERVLIMAGGTGGHVFPGLALAQSLRERGVQVQWLGTQQGIEARLVPEATIPLHVITISGVRGKGIKPILMAPINVASAVMQAKRIIQEVNPQVVIGMGGYASGPGGIASYLMRRPLIIHEQNAKAGITNKVLARVATRVLEGFPGAFKAQSKVSFVGNPVRKEIECLPSPDVRSATPHQPCRLLIIGGSLGAQALNETVPKMLAELKPEERPQVWHQTGDKHFEAAKKQYQSMGIDVNLQPFIKDMASAYGWADMVICRAGALTVAELCAAGLPAIFIPFPQAVDDHQTANADFMVKEGAAFLMQQSQLTESKLAAIVRELCADPDKRLAMANAAYALRKINVVDKIVHQCEEIYR